ncbi:sporulation integral membrane protein YtvI [Natribacillus halophilus]|uniref:Sporulation integral membrane protein YtvI n=1 Tax=Natribacillus halophilus TaxID=549003 RepID=A0A1G8NMI4_9BACI|nr:sporulation integral membrane protein YtvI [Natribacillus halophilus]SDI81395.1 sporulation integral membrane protein YtvI [Natribacillus halophilus]
MTKFITKRNITIVIVVILLIVAGYFVLPVSLPIITAFFTALLLSPAVKFLIRRARFPRHLSVITVFSLFLVILGASTYFITAAIVTQGIQFVENIPRYINEINNALIDFQNFLEDNENLPAEFGQVINREVRSLLSELGASVSNVNILGQITAFISSIPGYFVSIIVYVIALFLFLLDMPRLKKMFYSYLKDETQEKVNFMALRFSNVIFGFIKAQFLVSLIILAVTLVSLYWITPEVALIMSLIIWLIDLIPIIGSVAILAPWGLFQFIAGDVVLGTQLLILAAVLLTIRRTIEPKVMGTRIGLSPLATLISLYLGLMVFGVIGFVLGPLLLIAFLSAKEAGIIKMDFKI